MNKLTHVDKEGNELFGYSQTSLDKNTFWTRIVVLILGLILIYGIWLTGYVIKNNVVNNIVAACVP